jgi:hypothetical protein
MFVKNINTVVCYATEDAVQIVNWFSNHLQIITTITYNTVTYFHNLHSLHASFFRKFIPGSVRELTTNWFECRPIRLENWTVSVYGLQDNSSARTPRKTVSLLLRFVYRAIAQ